MKILGFHFTDRPTVDAHILAVKRRFRQKYWTLIHLKKYGFSEEELATVYKTIVRPVADYCSVVYHPMMTDAQDEEMDRCQAHALRCIYGMGVSYAEMRRRAGVPTLRQRRIDQCDAFASKCLDNPKFRDWFPMKTGRTSGRSGEKYHEKFARCNRLRNTPLYYVRRRLNGKERKDYGARNRDRRENSYRGGDSTVAWMENQSN